MKDADCVGFLQWAAPRLGLRWRGLRRVRRQVCKRLQRRLHELALIDLETYRARLEANRAEWRHLDTLCRISISRFYRDREVFGLLERDLLPRLEGQVLGRGEQRLRIWSLGCASGEEPYTLALTWSFRRPRARCDVAIFASDADPHLLARAARACYPPSSLRDLPEVWRAAFVERNGELCLKPQFRARVTFARQDVRREMPEGPFDLILCRNLVFTYFVATRQTEIARRLANLLVPGGLLLLGSHEKLPEPLPALVADRPWLYRRRL